MSGNSRVPGPEGAGSHHTVIDVGTLALTAMPAPGIVEGPTSVQGETWTTRPVEFVRLGVMTREEAAHWVNAQRNALLIAVRDGKNSPLGRAISEYLKPRDTLPQVPDLVARQAARKPGASADQIFEAIIRSGAKTRVSVNRVSIAMRVGGPALIVVNIGFSAVLIAAAPPEERGRVAAREGAALAGGALGGWGGAKLGCIGGAKVGVWFKGVGAVPGCVIGAIVGGIGVGWAGATIGAVAGEGGWDLANTIFEWQ